MDQPWLIEMFGWLRVVQADRVVSRFRTRKAAALLAYLAYHRHRSHPREQLIELLWPESPLEAGQRNLRTELASLRHQLEPPGVPQGAVILATRETVQLNPAACDTDVARFEGALKGAERAASPGERVEALTTAVELYRGELLPGYFDDWVLPEQERLAQAYVGAVLALVRHLEQMGQLHPAIQHACRAVAADPLREEAHHELIRLYAVAGQPAAALRQYQELERILRDELDQAPSAETRDIADAIRSGVQVFRYSGVQEAINDQRRATVAGPAVPEHLNTRTPEHPNTFPVGTVTFLRTDIEGSTAHWERSGEAFRAALASHHALLRREFARHGGAEVKEMGDGFLVAFARAGEAITCALAGQRTLAAHAWPETVGAIRVRMALHTGDVAPEEGDYHGPALNRVSRLVAAGHGGQILLSHVTQGLAEGDLPADASLRDLGRHRLRDLERPEHLFQLVYPELTAEFPPLRSLDASLNNLPLQLTSFIGRERPMAEVKRLLTIARLLTLTGPGGCGKTRLAVQAAVDLLDDYPDGVWLIELAALSDPGLVPQTVATALDVREQPGRPFTETLAEYCKSRSLLLVLDNCEHLLGACAALADSILRRCPGVRILATSREGLGIAGEQAYRVPSLSLPDPREWLRVDDQWSMADASVRPHQPSTISHQPSTLMQFEAVRLFVDRAVSIQPTFAVTEANAPAVAQICHRLDGIPLAIELAAARVRALPVEEIAGRLDDRFRLLTGGSRTAVPRQQTLRALIDWSFDLLSEPERMLLRRLSVFSGGCTLAAAETVCSGIGSWVLGIGDATAGPIPNTQHPTPSLEEWQVLELLTALVEKSLIQYEPYHAEARYRLLETIRQYGRDRLLEAAEDAVLRRLHADWFLQLAERAEPELIGANQDLWLDRLEREHDNLRGALAWSVSVGSRQLVDGSERPVGSRQSAVSSKDESVDPLLPTADCPLPTNPDAGLRLGAALWRFWEIRGYLGEGREHLASLLALPGAQAGTAARARALFAAGTLARSQNDYGAARALLEQSLEIFRELGEKQGIAWSLAELGFTSRYQGEYKAARALFEESRAIFRELGLKAGIAWSLSGLGQLVRELGDYEAARAIDEESVGISREVGDKRAIAYCLINLGLTNRVQGYYGAARQILEESLVISREAGNKRGIGLSLNWLAEVALDQGEYGAARELLEESLPISREVGEKRAIASALRGLGDVACAQGDHQAARALLDESLAMFRELGLTGIVLSLNSLGWSAHVQGDSGAARAFFEESLGIGRMAGRNRGIVSGLEGLAAVAAAQGQSERAAHLFGAAEALREAMGAPLPPAERAAHNCSVAAARTALGEEAFAAAWAEGRAMSLEQSIGLALHEVTAA